MNHAHGEKGDPFICWLCEEYCVREINDTDAVELLKAKFGEKEAMSKPSVILCGHCTNFLETIMKYDSGRKLLKRAGLAIPMTTQ